MHWQWPVGAVLAFLLALLTTPAGVSGAVLLLPVQLSETSLRRLLGLIACLVAVRCLQTAISTGARPVAPSHARSA